MHPVSLNRELLYDLLITPSELELSEIDSLVPSLCAAWEHSRTPAWCQTHPLAREQHTMQVRENAHVATRALRSPLTTGCIHEDEGPLSREPLYDLSAAPSGSVENSITIVKVVLLFAHAQLEVILVFVFLRPDFSRAA